MVIFSMAFAIPVVLTVIEFLSQHTDKLIINHIQFAEMFLSLAPKPNDKKRMLIWN